MQKFPDGVPSEDLTGPLQKVQSDSRFWIFPSADLKNHCEFKFWIGLALIEASRRSRSFSTTPLDYGY